VVGPEGLEPPTKPL